MDGGMFSSKMTLPFSYPCHNGLRTGMEIKVQGRPAPNCSHFTVNLFTQNSQDIALHFNARLKDRTVVRNHRQAGVFGTEERAGDMPFLEGSEFELKISVLDHAYHVAVNGVFFCEFAHRMPKEQVRQIYLAGDLVLHAVGITGQDSQVPPPYFPGGGVVPGFPADVHVTRTVSGGVISRITPAPGAPQGFPAGGVTITQSGFPPSFPGEGAPLIYPEVPPSFPMGSASPSFPSAPGYPSPGALNSGSGYPPAGGVNSGSGYPPAGAVNLPGYRSVVAETGPISNPSVPVNTAIPGGFGPHKKIYIAGTAFPGASRFNVNLACGSAEQSDLALHLDVRFDYGNSRNVVVRTHKQGGNYGSEERQAVYFPFAAGANFEMLLQCESDRVKIVVNNAHFVDFNHRIQPIHRVDHLQVQGDVSISKIRFQ